MTACHDVEPLLLDRSTGDLADADSARLDEHLAGCAACRAEAAALDRALALVRLPPPDAAERAALAGLADSIRLAQQARAQRRAWPARFAAVLAVAAAAAFLVAPAFTRRAPTLTPEEVALARAAAAPASRWTVPDPDELWDTAGALLSDQAAATASSTAAPAASTDVAATSGSATPLGRDRTVAIAAADAWFDTDTTAR